MPSIEINLQITDESPIFLRPFHVKEEDKSMRGKQIQRLVHLHILKQYMSPYSSPIMLTIRKYSSIKIIITDFKFLSSRFQVNLASPLL